jgi:choline dehydrogenase-like flavoprotein
MKVTTGNQLSGRTELKADVCIVGSGAGGGVLAWQLTQAGHKVVMLEAGSHHTTQDFAPLEERLAYPALYQERMTRATKDAAISVLQGRTVGGTTTVNWTTCFRTPERILAHWQQHFGVELGDMLPHYEAVEERLGVAEWPVEAANANNLTLWRGCKALGWQVKALRRNVRGCVSSGYCGLGCAFGAKQGMLLTTLPDAVNAGMELYADCRVLKVERQGQEWEVQGQIQAKSDLSPTGAEIRVRAKRVVLSAGAIGSPGILLRSGINPNGAVGKRTFLHPVVAVAARYPEDINGWAGAPQAVGSHEFVDRGEQVGFFLEVPPMQPMLVASGVMGSGSMVNDFMAQLPKLSSHLALMVDGLHPGAPGGTVELLSNGRPKLDYPIGPALVEAMATAHKAMARCHLAAGAQEVFTLHPTPVSMTREDHLDRLDAAAYGALEHSIFSAHQMGGCGMSGDAKAGVVDAEHRVKSQDGLYVVDGSVMPTSLGVNPSQTIYSLAHRAAGILSADL